MFCASCGTSIDSDGRFCPNCGVALKEPVLAANSTVPNNINSIVGKLRHYKEDAYFTIGVIAGVIVWMLLIWFVLLFIWIIIPILIGLWISGQVFRARFLGGAIKVGPDQYTEIFNIVERQSRQIGLAKIPEVFVVNENGFINGYAQKYLSKWYVILNSDLVDVMLAHESTKEFEFAIGHEIGHHAAGHLVLWKQYLMRPAMFIPFFGAAYSRSCELTADRIGMYLCSDKEAACRSLITLACGSRILSPKTNLSEFENQEALLSPLFAFLHDLYSTHPRITRRVIEIKNAQQLTAN